MAQTQLITATTLGAVSDSRSFDGFGGLTAYSATRSGNSVYSESLSRDALGPISSRIETIGGIAHAFAYTYDIVGD